MITAEIITIGDEILIGQIIDSNSAWIAEELTKTGFKVNQISSISDTPHHIIHSLEKSLKKNDLVLLTGGLGPTKDDLSKQTLCSYFNDELILNIEVLNHIEKLLAKRNVPMNDLNRSQAMLPSRCELIPNHNGTAAGMVFKKGNKRIISLPGVPYEMKAMLTSYLPEIQNHFNLPVMYHKTVLTQGYAESHLAKTIADWENNLPDYIKLAYLPSPGMVRLRLSMKGTNLNECQDEIASQISTLQAIIGDAIFGFDKDSLEEVVGRALLEQNKTLSTAESCTGGNIAGLITRIPGSSEYFKGSVVAYANKIKVKLLNVSSNDIEKYGAVSRQVVEQMAVGVLKLQDTDYSIATSGIAGPGGGSLDKPVGTIWIAVASKDQVVSKKFLMGDHRERNIRKSSLSSLNMLRVFMQNK